MDEIKISEVRHGSLHLVRRCRVVTYVIGTDDKGHEEVVCEVDDNAANELLSAIATAQVVTQ
jgi:DNA gyrase/topoisomerase IV subunit B